MEQEKKSFPIYNPGQFLSSDDLNASFSYLEEQVRITRADASVGYGIFKGLPFTRTNDGITIGNGVAVTSDGYLISYPEEVTYHYMILYEEGMIQSKKPFSEKKSDLPYLEGAYLLFETKEEIDNLELDQVEIIELNATIYSKLNDYTGALIIDFRKKELVNCNQQTCDLTNTQTTVECRPVFMLNNNTDPTELTFEKIDTIRTEQLNNRTIESRDFIKLQDMLKNVNISNVDKIIAVLNKILNIPNGNLLFSAEKPDLEASITVLESRTRTIPHFYLFIEDLKMALNEFISFYNYYIENYRIYSTIQEKERLILLETPNRTYFRPQTTSHQQDRDMKLMQRLLKRIPAIISAYSESADAGFRITPYFKVPSELGEYEIPLYYDTQQSGFAELWHTVTHGIGTNTFNPNKRQGVNNIMDYPFFKVEGCQGMAINDAYNKITAEVKKYALPVQVLKFEMLINHSFTKVDIDNLKRFTNLYKIAILDTDIKSQRVTFTNLQKEKITNSIPNHLLELNKTINSDDFVIKDDTISFSSLSAMTDTKKTMDALMNNDEELCVYYNWQTYKSFKKEVSNRLSEKLLAALDKFYVVVNNLYIESKIDNFEYTGGFYSHSGQYVLVYNNGKVFMEISRADNMLKIIEKPSTGTSSSTPPLTARPIEDIDGIGKVIGGKFRMAGIETVAGLLEKVRATSVEAVAASVGLTEKSVRKLVENVIHL